jgi:hypothetical protein
MLKRLLARVLKTKTVDLDNDGKIETLREEIEGVTSQFRSVHDKLDQINRELFVIVEEEEAKIAESQRRLERAKGDFKLNEELQNKVSQFI